MNQQTRNRNKEIIRCSLIGIGMNLVLSVSKIIAGSLIHSHAIMIWTASIPFWIWPHP